MIPIQRSCDVENLDDFSRYYTGGWVGWHGSDSAHIQPHLVRGMYSETLVQLRPLVKGDGNRFGYGTTINVSWTDLREHIDFGLPDIGMMPDGPTVLFCSYTTPKAPKKGYRAKDTRNCGFNTWDIRKKYNDRSQEKYDWTWFAFNPEYKSLENAEDRLGKGEMVGIPLSRTLAVYTLPKSKYSLLAYKRWTVGHVVSPYLISLQRQYADYEEDIAKQTGAEVIVG